eukprot:CAMPEP_0179048192 /NCGR_PEP_ID=MMETSP0796-20121207/19585_1 /TAXON_ID=73915 /ORGANISM="Pyrodinium bahamense, Strain pbaha01" /LENGTH=446 /DNA_ID=CAMNT_0020744659 /DNA_START=53 /DNA_END=1393 /DNA_ORIENTATION=-
MGTNGAASRPWRRRAKTAAAASAPRVPSATAGTAAATSPLVPGRLCRVAHPGALRRHGQRASALVARKPPAPPASAGACLLDVDTPALVVELDALEANIQRMAEALGSFPDVALRPHVKSHKTVEVAILQMQQPGTVGVCCQKVSEAVAMADAVGDILLSNQVAAPAKARRLAAIARRGCSVTAVVDSLQSAEVLAAASRGEGVRLGVLIDVNVGQDRCGVSAPADAVVLAQGLSELEGLHFRGIQAYQGLAQHVRDHSERAAAAASAADLARATTSALSEAGFGCEVVTGGGTGTCEFDVTSGIYTEVQPGSYVFGDADYARNLDAGGAPVSSWRQSLFVAATVISRNQSARRVVLDAGLKAVSYDSGPPLVRGWPESAARIESGGDEHTILHVRSGTALPALGDQLLLVPGHCDPTVNLHDHMLGLRGGIVETVWPVAARGPGH